MRIFILLLCLGLLRLPVQAVTDVENRENFRLAIEMAKKADEAVVVYTGKSPPSEEDLRVLFESVDLAARQGQKVESETLKDLDPELPRSFGFFKVGYIGMARGFERRDNALVKKGAAMVVEWQEFWKSHRWGIARRLASLDAEEKSRLFDEEVNRAAVERVVRGRNLSRQPAFWYAVGTLASLVAGWWALQKVRMDQVRSFLLAVFHVSFAFGALALFAMGFGREPAQIALYWLAALGLASVGVFMIGESEKPKL